MITIVRRFEAVADDGRVVRLRECAVETPVPTAPAGAPRTHTDRYVREDDGGMWARRARPVGAGVFELEDGLVVRERTA